MLKGVGGGGSGEARGGLGLGRGDWRGKNRKTRWGYVVLVREGAFADCGDASGKQKYGMSSK